MDEMEELRQEFFSEANELLQLMEEEVLNLEADPQNKESVNSIFRVAHTLKGGASTLEFERVAVFTHNLENLLDLVRDSKLDVDEELIDIILKSLDILTELIKMASLSKEAAPGFEDVTLESIKVKAGEKRTVKKTQETSIFTQVEKPKEKNSEILQVNFGTNNIDDSIREKLIKDFNIGDTRLKEFSKNFEEGFNLYVIYISLDPNYEMKSVSGIQTITALRSIGEIIECEPPLDHIMVEEFVPQIQFLCLSKSTSDQIYSKIYLSDVVLDIEIENVGELFGQIITNNSQESGSTPLVVSEDISLSSREKEKKSLLDIFPYQEMTEEIQQEILMSLGDKEKVFNIRLAINKDVPMRDVDSLLVLTTLEEVADIISAVPSKRDLQKDIFYPVLDIIIKTIEDKESIIERCNIEETILEMRVSEYLMKDNNITREKDKKVDLGTGEVSNGDFHLENESKASPLEEIKVDSTLLKDNLGEEKQYLVMGSSPNLESILDTETVDSLEDNQSVEKNSTSFSNKLESKEESRIKGKDNVTQQLQTALRSFIKVDSARVDILLNLVGELVISKAALFELSAPFYSVIAEYKIGLQDAYFHLKNVLERHPDSYPEIKKVVTYLQGVALSWTTADLFENIIGSISRSVNELQGGIMKIRMVPIGNVFSKFSRLVRDVSKQLGKKVRLEIIGEDTELDKSIIEDISDPLMHMVRNSVDHGIEIPEIRLSKGKAEEGKITLKATHEGNVIRIDVLDDGAGLDPSKIQKKAVEKGLINPNHNLSKDEILQLILLPGFSTAETITGLSGRGVGMDVVRRNIEDLSGTLNISSEFGKGSTFTIKIPLTLSIIQALVVKVKGYYYSIPLNVVSETIPLNKSSIQHFERSEIIYLNDEMVTIIDMKDIFNIKESREERFRKYQESMLDAMDTALLDESIAILEKSVVNAGSNDANQLFTNDQVFFTSYQAEQSNEEFLVIVNVGNKKIGIIVDNIIAEQDIVIKPLHKQYALTQGVSGATILGDGSISLIIDVYQLTELYIQKDDLVSLG